MKVILSKDDIESLVKEYFDMESVSFQDDGTIIIDSTLEKITNEKNNMDVFNEKIGKNNLQTNQFLSIPYYEQQLIRTPPAGILSRITNRPSKL